MNDAILKLAVALIGLVATYIGSVLIPNIKAKTTIEQQKTIQFWVDVAVYASEQMYNGKGLGAKKKEEVLKFINDKGFNVTEAELNMLIESSVKKLRNEEDKRKVLEVEVV